MPTIGRKALTACLLAAALVAGTAAAGQFGRFSRRGGGYDHEPSDTEFVLVRWRFGGAAGGYFANGWSHDYPDAEQHILQLISELTAINVDRLSYRVLDLSSPEIFKYPFSYMSHPGDVELTDAEVENLREYVERGGFVMLDDFGGQGQGPWEFETVRSNFRRAFPDREMFELSLDHEIFRSVYDVNPRNAVHPMSGAQAYFLGFPDGRDGTAMIICYHNDVGDYWEYLDNPRYPLEPSGEAVRLGVNFAFYAMTH